MKSTKYYQFGNPLKIAFRKHSCMYCGNSLDKRKHNRIVNSKSSEARYFDFTYGETNTISGDCNFIHKVFYCSKCGKEIEFVTQLSYEDNEKWIKKAYSELLKYFKAEQIGKVWIDNNGNPWSSALSMGEFQRFLFVITINGKKHNLPCSIMSQKNCWGRPIFIERDNGFYNAFSRLKQLV